MVLAPGGLEVVTRCSTNGGLEVVAWSAPGGREAGRGRRARSGERMSAGGGAGGVREPPYLSGPLKDWR